MANVVVAMYRSADTINENQFTYRQSLLDWCMLVIWRNAWKRAISIHTNHILLCRLQKTAYDAIFMKFYLTATAADEPIASYHYMFCPRFLTGGKLHEVSEYRYFLNGTSVYESCFSGIKMPHAGAASNCLQKCLENDSKERLNSWATQVQLTTQKCPCSDAKCSGVLPSEAGWLTSEPCSSSNSTSLSLPCHEP